MDLSNLGAVAVTCFELIWSRPHLNSRGDISRCPLKEPYDSRSDMPYGLSGSRSDMPDSSPEYYVTVGITCPVAS